MIGEVVDKKMKVIIRDEYLFQTITNSIQSLFKAFGVEFFNKKTYNRITGDTLKNKFYE